MYSRHSITESKKLILDSVLIGMRKPGRTVATLLHFRHTATQPHLTLMKFQKKKRKKERKYLALMSPFFLQAELILSFGASKYRPYVGSALAIRLHCGAGGWVHQEKISPPLCRPLSHWPVTRPAPFEGTPDIPVDNLFHSSAQLSEDRPNHSTRPALWGPFQKVLFSALSLFYAFPLSHLIDCNSKREKKIPSWLSHKKKH